MDVDLFSDLKQSLKEAKAIRHRHVQPSRRFLVDRVDVKSVRERTQLSQQEFAAPYCPTQVPTPRSRAS